MGRGVAQPSSRRCEKCRCRLANDRGCYFCGPLARHPDPNGTESEYDGPKGEADELMAEILGLDYFGE
jgi:hypothetical protein